MAMWLGITHSDEPTQNYHLALQFPAARSVLAAILNKKHFEKPTVHYLPSNE